MDSSEHKGSGRKKGHACFEGLGHSLMNESLGKRLVLTSDCGHSCMCDHPPVRDRSIRDSHDYGIDDDVDDALIDDSALRDEDGFSTEPNTLMNCLDSLDVPSEPSVTNASILVDP